MTLWRYLDRTGGDAGRSEEFEDQAAAEAWLGQEWSDLLERHVDSVELIEGDQVLYRMSLRGESQ